MRFLSACAVFARSLIACAMLNTAADEQNVDKVDFHAITARIEYALHNHSRAKEHMFTMARTWSLRQSKHLIDTCLIYLDPKMSARLSSPTGHMLDLPESAFSS